MISAKDELAHLVECLTEEEAQRVLDVLDEHYPDLYRHLEEPPGPRCPSCGESDLDLLVWYEDHRSEWASCHTCGFSWDPNRDLVHRPK